MLAAEDRYMITSFSQQHPVPVPNNASSEALDAVVGSRSLLLMLKHFLLGTPGGKAGLPQKAGRATPGGKAGLLQEARQGYSRRQGRAASGGRAGLPCRHLAGLVGWCSGPASPSPHAHWRPQRLLPPAASASAGCSPAAAVWMPACTHGSGCLSGGSGCLSGGSGCLSGGSG